MTQNSPVPSGRNRARRPRFRPHYDHRQRQRIAGRDAGADLAHENPRAGIFLHGIASAGRSSPNSLANSWPGAVSKTGMVCCCQLDTLPISPELLTVAADADAVRRKRPPIPCGSQGQLAREFLWFLDSFRLDHLHCGVEPAPNAPDFSDRAEAAEVSRHIHSVRGCRSFDQRPQGLDFIDEGEPLSHLIQGRRSGWCFRGP